MKKRLAHTLLIALTLVFVLAGFAEADFVDTAKGTIYQNSDGTYLKGFQKIGKELYYFGNDGILRKNGWFSTPDKKRYYASKTGALLRNKWIKKKFYVTNTGEKAKGLTKIGKNLFYFSPKNGKLQKGKLKDLKGNLYITNQKGAVYHGTLFMYKNKRYYAHEDGKLAKGLTQIGNDYYCFRQVNGTMFLKKKKKVNGYYYYFSADGRAARKKWVRINKKYYYFQEDGRMATNMFIGKRWYVNEKGERIKAADAPKAGVNEKNGKYYLYDTTGTLITNKWVTVDDSKYYAGADGAALIGLQTIDNKKYYFDEKGVLQTDTVVVVSSVAYSVAEDGHITGTSDASGASMAEYAQKFVGNPYVWGGTDPVKGADCSGFCYAIHQKFGIQLMRVADDQMKGPSKAYIKLGYKKGVVIKDKDLQPGDLVFYGSSQYASHVAMYIGNNKIVHAANSRLGIIISEMDYVKSRVKDHNMRYWA